MCGFPQDPSFSFHPKAALSLPDNKECSQGEQDSFYAKHNSQHFAMESYSSEQGANWPDQSGNGAYDSSDEEESGWWIPTPSESCLVSSNNTGMEGTWLGMTQCMGPCVKACRYLPPVLRAKCIEHCQACCEELCKRVPHALHKLCDIPDESGSQETEKPVQKTKVMEYHHKICFSTKPVKQCPDGTHPAENQQQQGNSSSNEQRQQQQQKQTISVPFTCVERSSAEARRLLRKARRGVVTTADIGRSQASFTEQVQVPSQCIAY